MRWTARPSDCTREGVSHAIRLGEGVAQVATCIAALREIGYSGWYSWEDEPEDRDPFDSAVRHRRWIEEQWL